MTVNINALINSLGKTYKEILDAELIQYKTPPTGDSGDPDISLDMAKEGVYLSFKRDGRTLQELTLSILRPEIKNWVFPNELPLDLQKDMTRSWIHEKFGEPTKTAEPRVVMKRRFGRIDLYGINSFQIPLSMRFDYDLDEKVKEVTFLPTANVRW
jgi:hypothetical protein